MNIVKWCLLGFALAFLVAPVGSKSVYASTHSEAHYNTQLQPTESVGSQLNHSDVDSTYAEHVIPHIFGQTQETIRYAIPLMTVMSIVSLVWRLYRLIRWIWKMYEIHKEDGKKWKKFKDEINKNKTECSAKGGKFRSPNPPQWTCEGRDGQIIDSGDYSLIFIGGGGDFGGGGASGEW
ncbi:MAG: hypothetical protein OXG24_12200 [Gammaproteobacteria bacterium]|nr:hypothetical protein [Gammaproteobacteria bacterium]